ncbi:hypothetical protein MHBO_002478, partial [Bonamia ostreae]
LCLSNPLLCDLHIKNLKIVLGGTNFKSVEEMPFNMKSGEFSKKVLIVKPLQNKNFDVDKISFEMFGLKGYHSISDQKPTKIKLKQSFQFKTDQIENVKNFFGYKKEINVNLKKNESQYFDKMIISEKNLKDDNRISNKNEYLKVVEKIPMKIPKITSIPNIQFEYKNHFFHINESKMASLLKGIKATLRIVLENVAEKDIGYLKVQLFPSEKTKFLFYKIYFCFIEKLQRKFSMIAEKVLIIKNGDQKITNADIDFPVSLKTMFYKIFYSKTNGDRYGKTLNGGLSVPILTLPELKSVFCLNQNGPNFNIVIDVYNNNKKSFYFEYGEQKLKIEKLSRKKYCFSIAKRFKTELNFKIKDLFPQIFKSRFLLSVDDKIDFEQAKLNITEKIITKLTNKIEKFAFKKTLDIKILKLKFNQSSKYLEFAISNPSSVTLFNVYLEFYNDSLDFPKWSEIEQIESKKTKKLKFRKAFFVSTDKKIYSNAIFRNEHDEI